MPIFTDTTGNTVSLPIYFDTSYNIVSFDVDTIIVNLFVSAQLYITLRTSTGLRIPKTITLRDAAYGDWGVDDNYLMNYIKTNIQTIYNS